MHIAAASFVGSTASSNAAHARREVDTGAAAHGVESAGTRECQASQAA